MTDGVMKFMDDGGGNMESRLDVEVSLAPGFLVTFAGARASCGSRISGSLPFHV